MKKVISLIISVILLSSLMACNAVEAKKEYYNCAYLTICFYNQMNSDNENNLKSLQNHDSMYYSNSSNIYCQINDWDYGENDTIILFLTDGRTIQTSSSNVLLMYQPELE